jgi:tRNA-specific 2-thiouridylase
LYVLALDLERDAVVVGEADALGRQELLAEEVTYVAESLPTRPLDVTVQIRYRAQELPALWSPLDGRRALVTFSHPLRDIAPGQGAVAYQGEVVVGGGIIA